MSVSSPKILHHFFLLRSGRLSSERANGLTRFCGVGVKLYFTSLHCSEVKKARMCLAGLAMHLLCHDAYLVSDLGNQEGLPLGLGFRGIQGKSSPCLTSPAFPCGQDLNVVGKWQHGKIQTLLLTLIFWSSVYIYIFFFFVTILVQIAN